MVKTIHLIILIAFAIIASACTKDRIVYRSEPLPVPVRPSLPPVYANELQCLSESAYQRLVMRNMQRRQYAEELEAIIISTHNEDTQ